MTADVHEAQLISLYREHWRALCTYMRRIFGSGLPELDEDFEALCSSQRRGRGTFETKISTRCMNMMGTLA